MKVLVIEDDTRIGALLKKGLARFGHVAEVAESARTGYQRIEDGAYDVVVLDVKLPDEDGFSVLAKLRQMGYDTPVLMLTARDSVEDKVRGLKIGADDYLTKPFAFEELMARLQALVRRPPAMSQSSSKLQVSGLEVDPVTGEASYRGVRLELSAKQLAVLEYLMRHAGQVVSRETLLDRVWESDFEPMANVVDAAVARLRAKLDPLTKDRGSLIKTVRGRGYKIER